MRDRLSEVAADPGLPGAWGQYFGAIASFYGQLSQAYDATSEGFLQKASLEELQAMSDGLYGYLSPEVYEDSFLNPAYAVASLGAECGGLLSALFAAVAGIIPAAYEGRLDLLCIYGELVLQVYCSIQDEWGDAEEPAEFSQESLVYLAKAIGDALYWFYHDYCEIFVHDQVRTMVDPEYSYVRDIILSADLGDDRYLYSFGLPVGPNELAMAAFLRTMAPEQIEAMARTYTEGYRIGFATCSKDISIKRSVQLHAPLGMERVTRVAIEQFRAMGLECTIAVGAAQRNLYSTPVNRQLDYDHKDDRAYYFDKSYVERRLEVRRAAFEEYKAQAKVHGGPAVVEVFGEEPFAPVNKPENAKLSDKQNQLAVYELSQNSQLSNTYIPGEERSYTIIAYPLPQIGEDFEAIFAKTVEVNTLDYELYRDMQQRIIDVLDQGVAVHITGREGNRTDLIVRLHPLADPAKQTIFENCVADVNIPVGEVFTSPVLEGTEGVLHVSEVYLNELCFKDLEITFRDGMIASYTCGNFATEEENLAYIKDNVLYRHDTLPMGEFAIGTNTVAYRMARDFGIAAKLPILIAEKTGPHFAVGDTCYSHSEDMPMYNPDGKECVARDNSVSLLRKSDISKAYFNCHTDITIPYDELGDITVLCADGRQLPVMSTGRFVVPGTEELNLPLDQS